MNSTESKTATPTPMIQSQDIGNILKTAKMGFWIIYPNGEHTRAIMSDEANEFFGIDEGTSLNEEEIYRWWYDRVYPDDMPIVKEYLRRLEACERYEITYRWKHPKTGIRMVRCGGSGRKTPDGTLVMQGYHYDITELYEKHKKDTLVAGAQAMTYNYLCYIEVDKNYFTAYRSKDPHVFDVLPENGKMTEVNKIIAEKFCAKEEQEDMLQFTDITTLNDRLKDLNTISTICQGVYVKWLRISFTVLDRNSDGTICHVLEAVKDVSRQREQELQMIHELKENIEANKSKTMMFQNMIHEIRTPLNAMFGFSQLLCIPGVNVPDDQKQQYANIIHNSFDMLTKLIEDVLDIVDAEHGNFRIRKNDFGVNAMCRSVIELVQMRVQAGVKLYFTTDVDDKFCLNSDEQRVEQVLINFLTNACKHTLEGEIHLNVSTSENPGHITFSVADTGTGIAPEMADDIFKRYKKANFNVNGSGIGLHICSIIAERLGAEVKLDRNYTNGARFLLII